jgi:hypothetical protein
MAALQARWIVPLALLVATPARAAGPSDTQVQAARELFQSAEKDEDAQRWSDALAKLRKVAAIRLTAGVRYHLALCEEHTGLLASALADYTAAENQARIEMAQDVSRLVGPRLNALSPRVPRLTVTIVPTDLPDAELRIDGEPIARALLGVPMPLNPGVHKLEAKATGRSPYSSSLEMRERDTTVLEIKLVEAAAPTPAPTPAPKPASAASTPSAAAPAATPSSAAAPAPSTTIETRDDGARRGPGRGGAILATASAVVLAGGGIAAFLLAGQSHDDGVTQCASRTTSCDDLKQTVRTWDTVAVGAWGGAAVAATIAVLLWTRPSSPEHATARVFVGPGTAGVTGSF